MKENSSTAGGGGASSAPAADAVEEDGASFMGRSEDGGGGRGAVATDGVREGGEEVSILDSGRLDKREGKVRRQRGCRGERERGSEVWLR